MREWTKEMVAEISGFGKDCPSYEEACRKMLIAGVNWVEEHPDEELVFGEYTNVYGIITSKSPGAEELEKAILNPVDDDCTGAMFHAVVRSVLWIKQNGWEKYVEEMSKRQDE